MEEKWKANVQRAEERIAECNYQEALNIIQEEKAYIQQLETQFEENETTRFFAFKEPMEQILQMVLEESEKEVKQAPANIGHFYELLGTCYIHLEEYTQAEESLKQALYWNPYSGPALLLTIQLLEKNKERKQAKEKAVWGLKHHFKKEVIGKLYGVLGRVFTEQEQYAYANDCYFLGMQYEGENSELYQQLQYVSHLSGETIEIPDFQVLKRTLEEQGIPVGPSQDIIEIALVMGQRYAEAKKNEMTLYYYKVVYDLTEDPQIREIIETL